MVFSSLMIKDEFFERAESFLISHGRSELVTVDLAFVETANVLLSTRACSRGYPRELQEAQDPRGAPDREQRGRGGGGEETHTGGPGQRPQVWNHGLRLGLSHSCPQEVFQAGQLRREVEGCAEGNRQGDIPLPLTREAAELRAAARSRVLRAGRRYLGSGTYIGGTSHSIRSHRWSTRSGSRGRAGS